MKKKVRVLHLASFEGNIGDNANHTGVRKLFSENLDYDFIYTDLEIREFHWKLRSFDENFVNLANEHDLVIIGGGNYFELWVEDSVTGTTINISKDMLEKINPPILFNGLGCDPGKGASEKNIQKFRDFLEYLFLSPKYLISVRNDGAMDNVKNYIGENYASKIYKVPDGGFFTEVKDFEHIEIPSSAEQVIGINIAGDMLDIRFPEGEAHIDYNNYLKEFGKVINELLEENQNLHIVFVPHIFRDLATIFDLFEFIEDKFRRRKITVAPYLHGYESQSYIFDLYRQCNLVLGMRFHANVCNIGLNIPTIGLVNYLNTKNLYRELQMNDRAVEVNKEGFGQKLSLLIRDSLENEKEIKRRYEGIRLKLLSEINEFHLVVNEWLRATLKKL